jgi:hypothetical protein
VPQRQCYTLGPFAEVQIAELLAGALAEAGVSAAQRSLEQQEVSSYWVYLAPYPSRNQAIALTRELAGRGVSDYYVVNSGEFANAVSLGLFSEQPRAERRVAQIRALGYSPILAPRYRSRTVHWVDYEQAAGGPAADAVWRELAGPEVQRLDRSCPRS